jgi:hypothetical protein
MRIASGGTSVFHFSACSAAAAISLSLRLWSGASLTSSSSAIA